MLAAGMHGPDDALVAADLAMYDAKAAGRNRYAFFDEDATAPSATRDRNLVFHVNLSGRSLGDEALLASIRAELERTGVDPCSLVFEITETAAVTNLEEARAFAVALTEMGCRLALDDFGAGFSSFVYLKQLPFHILKIDGEFVRQCTTTPADRVILESLVHTASGLDKQTVAEFVEDQETEDLLRELGVDLVQGYHVGRPISVEAAIATTHQISLM
jgi:EAL domain-containing protein (putative c-di-GMP-specific phosphodiesterase class I)